VRSDESEPYNVANSSVRSFARALPDATSLFRQDSQDARNLLTNSQSGCRIHGSDFRP
jgi:hypothetical protein